MKVVRRAHMYLGLLVFPWILLFGISGVLFNHPQIGRDFERRSISAEQVSASTQETGASTQEIAASAAGLSRTAADLDALVRRFVVA